MPKQFSGYGCDADEAMLQYVESYSNIDTGDYLNVYECPQCHAIYIQINEQAFYEGRFQKVIA